MHKLIHCGDISPIKYTKYTKLIKQLDKNWDKAYELSEDIDGYIIGNVTFKLGPFRIYFNFNTGEVEISEKQ